MRGPGGRPRRRCSHDTVHLIPLEAREGAFGGRGTEPKCRTKYMWELRWNVGAPGGWGSEVLVKVVGNMVGKGHVQGLHRNSKAARVVLKAV